jgi:hypothetical protein
VDADPISISPTALKFRAAISRRTGVIVFIGQSFSVNSIPTPYVPVNRNIDQINIYDGKLYKAKDPLLGVNGGGTVTHRAARG